MFVSSPSNSKSRSFLLIPVIGDLALDAMPDAILFVGDNIAVTFRLIWDDTVREVVGRVELARTSFAGAPEGTRFVAGLILIQSAGVMQVGPRGCIQSVARVV